MLIADLKGKLSINELVSEDYLTSSVFSVFRLIEDNWFEQFINQAVNIKREKLSIKLDTTHYEFWPWYSNDQMYGGGAEPDLVIHAGETALIIEAKNYSGKSGTGIMEDEEEKIDQVDLKKTTKIIVDQLGREYFVGTKRLLKQEIKNFYLVLLTRHITFPHQEILETIESIKCIDEKEYENAKNRIFWLNWQKIIPILEEIIPTKTKCSLICQELLEFLERRNLANFKGFDFLRRFGDFHIKSTRQLNNKMLFHRVIKKAYWSDFPKYHMLIKNQKSSSIFYNKSSISYWNNNFQIPTISSSFDHIFYRGRG